MKNYEIRKRNYNNLPRFYEVIRKDGSGFFGHDPIVHIHKSRAACQRWIERQAFEIEFNEHKTSATITWENGAAKVYKKTNDWWQVLIEQTNVTSVPSKIQDTFFKVRDKNADTALNKIINRILKIKKETSS